MKAVVVRDDRSLAWQEVADPRPAAGEALVRVYATALNRADLSQRAGHYPPPPGASEILGLELAGVVLEAPSGSRLAVGDRVCALVPGGGYAELAAVPEGLLMPVPGGWSFAEAAALPEAFFTAFLNLFLEAGLRDGERVLIHAGASGVGTAAIQLAARAGCRVFATAGSAEKVTRCRELGAEVAVNYRERDFADAVREHLGLAAGEGGIDVILDPVGEDHFARNLALLALGGRMVVIATLSGRTVQLDLRELMARRATLKGSTLRARPLAEKVRLKEAFVKRFWGELTAGRVAPVLDRVMPVAEVEAAHARMRANRNIGKIVLTLR